MAWTSSPGSQGAASPICHSLPAVQGHHCGQKGEGPKIPCRAGRPTKEQNSRKTREAPDHYARGVLPVTTRSQDLRQFPWDCSMNNGSAKDCRRGGAQAGFRADRVASSPERQGRQDRCQTPRCQDVQGISKKAGQPLQEGVKGLPQPLARLEAGRNFLEGHLAGRLQKPLTRMSNSRDLLLSNKVDKDLCTKMVFAGLSLTLGRWLNELQSMPITEFYAATNYISKEK